MTCENCKSRNTCNMPFKDSTNINLSSLSRERLLAVAQQMTQKPNTARTELGTLAAIYEQNIHGFSIPTACELERIKERLTSGEQK